MTVGTTPQVTTSTHDEWFDGRWRLTGLVIGLMVVLSATLLVTTGTRPATYGDLLSDVASSRVDQVQVIGPDAPAKGDSVELRWSVWGGILDQYAVVEVGDNRGYDAWRESVFVTGTDPAETLRSINPGISVSSGSSPVGSTYMIMEWRAPGAVVLLAMATWLTLLLLLVGGPEPWRATRWAWAWFMVLGGPLGSIAYLLLGGPLGVVRPRAGHRRLTGGWAFLISLVIFNDTWSSSL